MTLLTPPGGIPPPPKEQIIIFRQERSEVVQMWYVPPTGGMSQFAINLLLFACMNVIICNKLVIICWHK